MKSTSLNHQPRNMILIAKMTSSQELPKTHRALVLTSTSEPPEIKVIPTPQPGPGSAILQIKAANIISSSKDIYDGSRKHQFPIRLVIGTSAIGRVTALGPDAVSLQAGQLVLIDSFIRGRDDPTAAILLGAHEGHSEGSKRLMHGEW